MAHEHTPNYLASYVEGLKYELRGAVEKADKVAQAAVKAELDRVAGKKPTEKAVAPSKLETA